MELKHLHKGKESFPTRVYEVVVNHSKLIISVSAGAPGATSDKTVMRSDSFVDRLRFDRLFNLMPFTLFDARGEEVQVHGAYLITDAGYHKWRIFAQPERNCVTDEEFGLTSRLESVRKDVEDVFGILKVLQRAKQCSITI